jgi:hypothetical protein
MVGVYTTTRSQVLVRGTKCLLVISMLLKLNFYQILFVRISIFFSYQGY